MATKICKTIGLLRELQNILPLPNILHFTKHFTFYLDYVDVLYDQAFDLSVHQKLESVQYSTCLAIPGATRVPLVEDVPRARRRITLITAMV